MLAAVGLVYLVTPTESVLAKEVQTSRTGRFARVVVNQLDGFLSDDILVLYGLKLPAGIMGDEQDLAPDDKQDDDKQDDDKQDGNKPEDG